SNPGIKARYLIRYRFSYRYLPQKLTLAQRQMIIERTGRWENRMRNVYVKSIKRKLASLKKQNIERIYTITEKILYNRDLLGNLTILEIRKLVEFFSEKNPSYAIAVLEAARDYELGLDQQDYSMLLKLF